jgi:hypothetical protein
MLRKGASLLEIGEILRHRSPQTTAIYAKVDLDSLRPLAFAAMNTLQASLQDYLAMGRGLGFKLHDAGVGMGNFVSFMERKQASHITTPLALEWAQKPKSVLPSEWARRLSIARTSSSRAR